MDTVIAEVEQSRGDVELHLNERLSLSLGDQRMGKTVSGAYLEGLG